MTFYYVPVPLLHYFVVLLETPAARSVLHSVLILHVLFISFDILFAVRGSLHFDDHARSCSPGSTFTYYYAVLGSVYYAATMVLRCTRVLEVVQRHDSDVSFPFSVNFCRTVSQVGSKVTLLMEDLQGLRRWFLPEMEWEMIMIHERYGSNGGSNRRPLG